MRKLKSRAAKGEKVGGGYIVMGRHSSTGRVMVSPIGLPFEHPSQESAEAEMRRLAAMKPGMRFCVFAQVSEYCVDPPAAENGQPPVTSAPVGDGRAINSSKDY